MVKSEKIVVLGAGPAGIGAGLGLGEDGTVLDACPEPAGLCRNMELGGAVFDWGGHSFHTPHPEIRELVFSALEMYEQPREARCYVRERLIRYPFQAHYEEARDPELTAECGGGLKAAVGPDTAKNLEEYVVGRFGAGIARHFLLPYNRKLWGQDLRRLAVDWTCERIAPPTPSHSPQTQTPGRRTPLQQSSRVAYPARGGFGEVWNALARCLHSLRCQQAVTRIDPIRRQLWTKQGDVLPWRYLISTLPIDQLLALLPDVPGTLLQSVRRLEALPLALVFVVVDEPIDTPIQRVYSAGVETPAHKIVLNHNSSPWLRSQRRHGILAEVSGARSDPASDAVLEKQVIAGLLAANLLRSADLVHTVQVRHVRRAYPVPTHDREAIVCQAKAWLGERGIYSIGRFGEWAYINSDEALFRGLQLGRRLREVN
jgi:UDP-galactopyranose mutase